MLFTAVWEHVHEGYREKRQPETGTIHILNNFISCNYLELYKKLIVAAAGVESVITCCYLMINGDEKLSKITI